MAWLNSDCYTFLYIWVFSVAIRSRLAYVVNGAAEVAKFVDIQQQLTFFLTCVMIYQDEVPGLQVRLGGEWLDVPPRPAAFICNLGDMLQRW